MKMTIVIQASKSTLKERISFMYCNDILADIYFIVGKEESKQVRSTFIVN